MPTFSSVASEGSSFAAVDSDIGAVSCCVAGADLGVATDEEDRKSTRLNSSHVAISYAVFCLKKKMSWSVSKWCIRIQIFLNVKFCAVCVTGFCYELYRERIESIL